MKAPLPLARNVSGRTALHGEPGASPAIAHQVRQVLHAPHPQAKLTVGAPDDAFEKEADQVADQVMRMPEPGVQRMCHECEEELQAKEEPGQAPEVPDGFASRFAALRGGGQPLPAAERAFFEPRFGRDFSGVRLHSSPAAGDLARSVHARAFTLGDSIVFGQGQYAPGAQAGRQLLAHELTHVVQQGGAAPGVLRRQTITPSCRGNEAVLNAAWAEGRRLTERTIETLNNVYGLIGATGDAETVAPTLVRAIRNAFGEVGFSSGMTYLPDLIRRYGQILSAFQSGKDLRCDPQSVPSDKNECDWRVAFVIVGNSKDVFICPAFFDADRTLTQRGLTVLHELAHSVLRASHAGIAERTVPEALLACELPFGLDYDDAKKNAFTYEMLANCLHGERPTAVVDTTPAPKAESASGTKSESRWSISAAAGADVTPDAQRFAAALGSRVSLRTGEFVVFNPVIGLNLLYLPSSSANPSHLLAATADLGLRIQQPLEGFYFDVSAGGFAGFDIDPNREQAAQFTGGLTGTTGLGYRWKSLELGAEARALVPGADFDQTNVMVFGRAALRFP
jgi:Domain of unknown function (DUF4157)